MAASATGSPEQCASRVLDQFDEHAELIGETAVRDCLRFGELTEYQYDTDARGDQSERFVEGSARVLRVDEHVEAYAETTSDHYPVLTRYDLR